MRKSIIRWSSGIMPEGTIHMRRVIDTAMVLYRALDGFKRYFDETNVDVGDGNETVIPLGEWDESSFDDKGRGVLEFDITPYLQENGNGTYFISLDYIDSESGTDISRITLMERQPGGGEKPATYVRADLRRLSVWAPWSEYPLHVKNLSIMSDYYLRLDVSGMDKGAKTCRGLAGIRKV